LDVDEFVNDLQERANGHRKTMPAQDELLEDYKGHYDFEPAYSHERPHDTSPHRNLEDEYHNEP